MCMKYESEYGECFDELFIGLHEFDWIETLSEHFNCKINKEIKLKSLLLEALNKAHELNYIEPLVKDE